VRAALVEVLATLVPVDPVAIRRDTARHIPRSPANPLKTVAANTVGNIPPRLRTLLHELTPGSPSALLQSAVSSVQREVPRGPPRNIPRADR
jgi:hypothetical protein